MFFYLNTSTCVRNFTMDVSEKLNSAKKESQSHRATETVARNEKNMKAQERTKGKG